ncbi:MAG: serine/threonine-protein kinase [Myxococcales bacterium]
MQSPKPTPLDDIDAVLRDLARPPAPRAAFGAELAAQDTHPLSDAVRRVAEELQDSVPEPAPGEVLEERYRVLQVLGRGGMGVVLEAEALRTGKRVAIKWMSAGSGGQRSRAAVARFLREARAVATIQHPNVVNLYDVGDSNGVPFLVLERLHGESLRVRMRGGPLAWPEARAIMLGVLRGVAAVHGAGIVHRDLKPDNIFLCAAEGGEPEFPKVLDFGVAAMRERVGDGPESNLTRTGAVLGTPAYMALEQLTGKAVDVRSDVYALGAMLYEMLSGSLPFQARSAAELAVLQATTEPMRLSRLVPSLARAREQVVMRALSRKPEDRYPDVKAFVRALEECERDAGWRSYRSLGLSLLVALMLSVACALWYRAAGGARVRAELPPPAVANRFEPAAAAPAPPAAPTRGEQAARLEEASGGEQVPNVAPVEEAPAPPARKEAKRVRRAVQRDAVEELHPTEAAPRDTTEIRLEDF